MKGRKFLISLFVVVIVVISFVISVVINMMVVVIAVVVTIKSRPNLEWRSIISFRSNQRTIGGHRGVEFDQRSG